MRFERGLGVAQMPRGIGWRAELPFKKWLIRVSKLALSPSLYEERSMPWILLAMNSMNMEFFHSGVRC